MVPCGSTMGGGEIEICVKWVFRRKFNFGQLLLEAFFDIIRTFGNVLTQSENTFPFQYLIIKIWTFYQPRDVTTRIHVVELCYTTILGLGLYGRRIQQTTMLSLIAISFGFWYRQLSAHSLRSPVWEILSQSINIFGCWNMYYIKESPTRWCRQSGIRTCSFLLIGWCCTHLLKIFLIIFRIFRIFLIIFRIFRSSLTFSQFLQ